MPSIFIGNNGQTINASSAISVLNNLLRKGVAISHLCGGKAICGTCRIKVIDGMDKFNPVNERERNKFKYIEEQKKGTNPHYKSPSDVRLACQSYIFGNVKIKVLAEGAKKRR